MELQSTKILESADEKRKELDKNAKIEKIKSDIVRDVLGSLNQHPVLDEMHGGKNRVSVSFLNYTLSHYSISIDDVDKALQQCVDMGIIRSYGFKGDNELSMAFEIDSDNDLCVLFDSTSSLQRVLEDCSTVLYHLQRYEDFVSIPLNRLCCGNSWGIRGCCAFLEENGYTCEVKGNHLRISVPPSLH